MKKWKKRIYKQLINNYKIEISKNIKEIQDEYIRKLEERVI
jgi:hypothetical protein